MKCGRSLGREGRGLQEQAVTKRAQALHGFSTGDWKFIWGRCRWDCYRLYSFPTIGGAREGKRPTPNPTSHDYVHYFWLSREDYTPKKTLFKRIKMKVMRSNAKQFLEDLENGVETYRRIFEPENFKWNNEERPFSRSLSALQTFRVRQPTPLVFSLLRAYYDGDISLKQLKSGLHAVEAFHFQHTAIASLSSSGGISMMYAAAARELYYATDPQERAAHLQAFRQKLRERIPEDKAFAVQFGEVRFLSSDTKQRPLVRYILEKVDEQLRTDKMVDYDKMTIEHLSPENPGAGQQAKGLDAGNIGNLIFVSEGLNGKMKNKDFPAKKKILGEAGIPFDKVLKGATNWGSKEIAARAAQLAQLGREKIWKL